MAEFIRDVRKFDVARLGLTEDNANTKYTLPRDDCLVFLRGHYFKKPALSGQYWPFILPELFPLEQVNSPEELQEIFLGILDGTYVSF